MRNLILCGFVSPAPVLPANLTLPLPAAALTGTANGTSVLVDPRGPGL